MRRLTILVFAIALVLAANPAAAAVDAGPVSGTQVGGTVGYDPDPAAVAARCPAGSQWILYTAAMIEMESDVYSGPLFATSDHCSRWLHAPKGTGDEVLPGKIAAGRTVMTTPGGDTVILAYEGTFVFRGDAVTFTWFENQVILIYKVIGGTGIFDGATGHIVANMTDGSMGASGTFVGSLAVPG